MRVIARGIKLPNVAAVQRSHDTDPRHHGRAVELGDQKQGFYRSQPLIEILFGLRQAGDVVAGIAQSHDRAPTRQQDRIIEGTSPDGNRLSNVQSAIRLQECAERSIRVLFRRTAGQIVTLS